MGVGFALVTGLAAFGCTAGIAPASGDGGLDDASPEGAPRDGGAIDSAFTDGSSGEGGIACGPLGGGTYDNAKSCKTVSDCTTVARGCYCGGQPILGIAKTSAAVAEACEATAGSQCGLGCANFPGHVAEDGANDVDGGTIQVLCDLGKCHTVLR